MSRFFFDYCPVITIRYQWFARIRWCRDCVCQCWRGACSCCSGCGGGCYYGGCWWYGFCCWWCWCFGSSGFLRHRVCMLQVLLCFIDHIHLMLKDFICEQQQEEEEEGKRIFRFASIWVQFLAPELQKSQGKTIKRQIALRMWKAFCLHHVYIIYRMDGCSKADVPLFYREQARLTR